MLFLCPKFNVSWGLEAHSTVVCTICLYADFLAVPDSFHKGLNSLQTCVKIFFLNWLTILWIKCGTTWWVTTHLCKDWWMLFLFQSWNPHLLPVHLLSGYRGLHDLICVCIGILIYYSFISYVFAYMSYPMTYCQLLASSWKCWMCLLRGN